MCVFDLSLSVPFILLYTCVCVHNLKYWSNVIGSIMNGNIIQSERVIKRSGKTARLSYMEQLSETYVCFSSRVSQTLCIMQSKSDHCTQ